MPLMLNRRVQKLPRWRKSVDVSEGVDEVESAKHSDDGEPVTIEANDSDHRRSYEEHGG